MLHTVQLRNKPLTMVYNDKCLYIGDAGGIIYQLKPPFRHLKEIMKFEVPISVIIFLNDEICCGGWDGCIYYQEKSIKLGKDPIKCMIVYRELLYVSVDKTLKVLDFKLNCIEDYKTESKILCMEIHENQLILGLSTGFISTYTDKYIPARKSSHETSILSMKGELTGSADGTLRKGEEVLFQNKKWIRSIWNKNLFSAGNDVYYNDCLIYSHQDEVMMVIMIDESIISIGLDYCYKIYSDFLINKHEEDEIMKYLTM